MDFKKNEIFAVNQMNNDIEMKAQCLCLSKHIPSIKIYQGISFDLEKYNSGRYNLITLRDIPVLVGAIVCYFKESFS